MLQKLSNHIADCYTRSAECENHAREADDRFKSDYLMMAKRWSHLAKSYEFVEMLERFLLDAHKKRAPLHQEDLPKPPTAVD
jgi:hypothetical protein